MKVEITIPSSLREITLKQYKEFVKTRSNSDDAELIAQKMVSIFCNIPMNNVVFIKDSDFHDIVNHLNSLFEAKRDFVPRFTLGGKEFGFIPNLEEMTHGEFIDLDSNLNEWEVYNRAMAVMYRPIVKERKGTYEIEGYFGTANYSEVMDNAPLDICFGAMVFFYDLGNELLKAIPHYLEQQLMSKDFQTLAKQHNLPLDGDGIKVFIHSLREMLQSSMKLLNYPH